jgi:hypothetical protein
MRDCCRLAAVAQALVLLDWAGELTGWKDLFMFFRLGTRKRRNFGFGPFDLHLCS